MCDLEQWIKDHCWSNADFIHGEIRAVAVWFCGLGSGFRNSASDMDLALAESGVLVISPYYGPWSWMNRLARQLVDELLEKVFEFYQLKDDTPLISSGWSMGGLASLLYCRYGKRRPAGCCVLFPVCDLPFHFREREDVPPTVCYAFYGYDEPFESVLEEHSPLHQADAMPDIPYLFFHGDADAAVNKSHSDKMTSALRKLQRSVQYVEVPGMGHVVNTPLSVKQQAVEFMAGFAK